MSACFCTGICQRTGMCGGQQITGNWPPHQWVPEPYVKLPNTAGPAVEPEPSRTVPDKLPTNEAKPLHSGAWQCPACHTWYAYWVSKCECQKKPENIIGTLRIGETTTLPPYGSFTSEVG